MSRVREIKKEIERDFDELVEESKDCLLCFSARLKGFPFCRMHTEAFAYKLRLKLVKDYKKTTDALIEAKLDSKGFTKLLEYILDNPEFQYIFTENDKKGWIFRASYERVKRGEYPRVEGKKC